MQKWCDDIVSDSEFFNGMEHLIKEKIIEIPAETQISENSEKTFPLDKKIMQNGGVMILSLMMSLSLP